MNFVRYDPISGNITSIGWGNSESVQKEINDGMPTLAINVVIQWGQYRVDPNSKQLVPIT